ncbi:translocation/assembly module TamB domain-containing protein [Desertivirga arenae]|uniref:translocation/assembly module TamB domain-containing protein n=1 Tax=Desertivirga arenae TaxID=2810309 RepID=UPI003F7ABF0E
MKKVLKITLWTLTVIILLFAALVFSLRYKSVQTYIAKKAAAYLSKELKTLVDLKGIYVKPFKSLVLEGLYVQDLDKDTLLYSPQLTVDINVFSIENRRIGIESAQLDSGQFYFKSYKGGGNNLKFIIDYFKPKPSGKPKGKPYDITVDRIVLNKIAFKYRNFSRDNALKRINFDDIDLSALSTTVLNIDTKKHLFDAQVNNLTFREKSGFKLLNLTTKASIDTNKMEFSRLLLQTPHSRVSNYLLMRYNRFSDFKSFVSKVYVKANLKQSHIHSKDISFFADATRKMNLDLRVKGNLNGYVNNIRARNFIASAGQATYLKGNFTVKGLPSISKTYLELRFDQLHTNSKDIQYLSKALALKLKALPPVVTKLGNVSYSGVFKGLVKNFSINGEVKTALGRLQPNLRMNLAGTPTYSGVVKAIDFDLQSLLNRQDLGRATLTANISGKGFDVKNLSETVEARADYFDFRGYRYTNIAINGTYNRRFFRGKASINDRNIHLQFNGGINLDLKVPEFHFVASLRNTDFRKLGFTKDTLKVDADIRTNFTGTNLNNIQGNFVVRNIHLIRPGNSLVVNSLDLVAGGTGRSRSLTVKSDILDAEIVGQYGLQELPAYFKSVVKKYIPSLQLKTQRTAPQIFDINLKIKYFEPIAAFFMPQLKLPEGAVFNGKFNSTTNTATINGSSPVIEYQQIKLTNFILDESTTPEALNIFATADRIDLNNKFYIQNINVANILRNDSLALNVKLSDKDATNQLDLNGLVEFSTDTAARLSVLPSDVVINKEGWRIQEKVRLKFDQKKVYIENFELFRDNQLLTVDGVLSADPKDVLNVGFKQFKLATFNSLTAGSKVALGGMMNGHLIINTPLKKPKLESDISIDSLTMNSTHIGDLTLTANLDNETKLVEVEMNILKEGKETMFISGTYNANSENNKLNLDLIMNNSEAVLFQPFIKNLVSDLNGNVSASFKVTGNPLNPHIRGRAKLDGVGLTVNYLKTHYLINDSVRVENSVILLRDLAINDIYGHTATANGTVDMKNPKVPDIDIVIKADGIQALNTTAKDNPLYYGTAFGTGTFKFKGPTNNMRIDITARTEDRTVFNIPLNSSERVGNSNFITYVTKDSALAPPKANYFAGLVMNFELTVGESSQVNIITDLGKLSGQGRADPLVMKITSAGDFEMRGEYQISQGKFIFTAQDYFNKQFDIYQGGTIRWTGDPTQALINVNAVYSVRANLKDLYLAANAGQQSQTALTEAIINLQGIITQPKINLDLNFPNDAYIKDQLQSYFSNPDNTRTQAISIIVRRAFTNTSNFENTATSTLANAGTELTVNILNSIIAKSLNLKTVDINIRSVNDFGLSGRFFNDRLRITGSLTDVRATSSNLVNFNSSTGNTYYARDIELQYLIKKDGTLIARASNRLSNRSILTATNVNGQDYVNALGVVYRKDFDSLGEFIRAFVGKSRKEERKDGTPIPNPAGPVTPVTPSTPVPAPISGEPAKKAAGR